MSMETQPPLAARVFAEVRSMDEVREALRTRFDELQISRAAIDHTAQLQEGYSAKLLVGIKGFGVLTLFPMLQAAGLKIQLVDDPEALDRAKKLEKRTQHAVRCRPVGRALMKAARPVVLHELTAKAGRASMAKRSPEQRRQLARAAAAARWARRKQERPL
jgi:hypothetical protein